MQKIEFGVKEPTISRIVLDNKMFAQMGHFIFGYIGSNTGYCKEYQMKYSAKITWKTVGKYKK
jgi:hypothetical protein